MKRLIISFSGRCALKCSFCYAPFNGINPTEAELENILKFALGEHFDVMTFGGGDPLQYSFTRGAIANAKKSGLFVHVDTHGLGVKQSDYQLFNDCVDLIGLPLDGINDVHDSIRDKPGHFVHVTKIVHALLGLKTKLKINTLVSNLNVIHIEKLAVYLDEVTPDIWSIYQYMMLSNNLIENAKHSIDLDDFEALFLSLTKNHPILNIEMGSAQRRNKNYLFVRTDGTLFTHNVNGIGYLEIGNIKTNDWRDKYHSLNDSLLPELSKERYNV